MFPCSKRRNHIRHLSCVVGVILLTLGGTANADGGFFPEPAYPANPEIPCQRALIAFRDGTETMAVESSYATNSASVGWILPLPAEPAKLQQADSGMLQSVSMSMRPTITNDLREEVHAAVWLLVWLSLITLMVILFRDATRRWFYPLTGTLILMFSLALGLPMLMTAGLGSPDAAVPGISELGTQRVGNYDATIIKAADTAALDAWLTKNALKGLDANAKKIVSSYIDRKWCFVVARLRKDGQSIATPHPIVATFKTDNPVFPMQLTAIGGATTRVELFVAADGRAQADGFDCIASDRFNFSEVKSQYNEFERGSWSSRNGITIGNPDAGEFLWPNCVVTKLVADMKPSQMTQDVDIEIGAATPYRQHTFSYAARRSIVLLAAMGSAGVLLIGAMFVFQGRRPGSRRQRRVLGAMAAVFALGCVITYLAIPAIPTRSSGGMGHFMGSWRSHELIVTAKFLKAKGAFDTNPKDAARFPDLAVEQNCTFEEGVINPYTGEKMRMERTPGNYSLRTVGDDLYLCFYDEDGIESRYPIGKDPDRKAPASMP